MTETMKKTKKAKVKATKLFPDELIDPLLEQGSRIRTLNRFLANRDLLGN